MVSAANGSSSPAARTTNRAAASGSLNGAQTLSPTSAKMKSMKEKFGDKFSEMDISAALKQNDMDLQKSAQFLEEFVESYASNPFQEVTRRSRKKGLKPSGNGRSAGVGSPATSGMSKLLHLHSQTSSGPNGVQSTNNTYLDSAVVNMDSIHNSQNGIIAQQNGVPHRIRLIFGSLITEANAASTGFASQLVEDIEELNDQSVSRFVIVSPMANLEILDDQVRNSDSPMVLEIENQVQQQQQPEAMVEMYPLVHGSHQQGGKVVIRIDQTDASTSTSQTPARGGCPPPQPPSDTPPALGGAAAIPPDPVGPPSSPPSPPTPHLPPHQDHYWTVIHADRHVEITNLSSKQVLQKCNLNASEEARISCVDIKYPSYVLPTTAGYSIVILPQIFCIIGRERSYSRHDKPVVGNDDLLAGLAEKIAKAWCCGDGFDLHVMEGMFDHTLEGLLIEKERLDLSSSGAMTQVARIEAFISKNRNVKKAAKDVLNIFRDVLEKGSCIPYFICRCEDNIRHLSDVVKEVEGRMVKSKDWRDRLLFGLTFSSAIAAFLGMMATLLVGITPSSSPSPSPLPPSLPPSPLPSPSITPSLPPILTLQKTLFSIGGIFAVLILLCWIVVGLSW